LFYLVATCRDCFCLFDTNFCCYLLLNTSSSGIKVSGNRAQRNYGYACDSKQSERRWIEVDLSKATVGQAENRVMLSSFQPESYPPPPHRVLPFNRGIALLEWGLTTIFQTSLHNVLLRNYAIHGTWHHRFGTPVSHGCINVAVDHARWLFNWTSVGTPSRA